MISPAPPALADMVYLPMRSGRLSSAFQGGPRTGSHRRDAKLESVRDRPETAGRSARSLLQQMDKAKAGTV